MRSAGSGAAGMATSAPGCSPQYAENSRSETGERMNDGAVNALRSPRNDASVPRNAFHVGVCAPSEPGRESEPEPAAATEADAGGGAASGALLEGVLVILLGGCSRCGQVMKNVESTTGNAESRWECRAPLIARSLDVRPVRREAPEASCGNNELRQLGRWAPHSAQLAQQRRGQQLKPCTGGGAVLDGDWAPDVGSDRSGWRWSSARARRAGCSTGTGCERGGGEGARWLGSYWRSCLRNELPGRRTTARDGTCAACASRRSPTAGSPNTIWDPRGRMLGTLMHACIFSTGSRHCHDAAARGPLPPEWLEAHLLHRSVSPV